MIAAPYTGRPSEKFLYVKYLTAASIADAAVFFDIGGGSKPPPYNTLSDLSVKNRLLMESVFFFAKWKRSQKKIFDISSNLRYNDRVL